MDQKTLGFLVIGAVVLVGLALVVVLAERGAIHRTLADIRNLPERQE